MADRREPSAFIRITRSYSGKSDKPGLYVMSVASRLSSMHPNTLRKYENVGLLSPNRTDGRQRLYSNDDIVRLKLIRRLNEQYNLNTQSIRVIMDMVVRFERIASRLEQTNDSTAAVTAKQLAKEIREYIDGLLQD